MYEVSRGVAMRHWALAEERAKEVSRKTANQNRDIAGDKKTCPVFFKGFPMYME